MNEASERQMLSAAEDFRTARLRASLEQVKSALTGKSADLLSYEDVKQMIGARETARCALKEIPLTAIVGSVGRYTDFTRSFLPLLEENDQRWIRVRAQAESAAGWPPIEVFQVGETYFVRDGNHRVSVARQMGHSHIEAYVTRVETEVPLTPDVEPDDLIIKAQYARFLERTRLKEAYPELDLSMTAAGNYRVLQQQIAVHQHWLADHGPEPSFSEAAADWYATVYLPVIQVIRHRGFLHDFPGRTETDLYVWVDRHRHELKERLGWWLDAEAAATDLVETRSDGIIPAWQRLGEKVRGALAPYAQEIAPLPVSRRQTASGTVPDDRLFRHVLVALDGRETGWQALAQALHIARLEKSRIFGLHVVAAPEAQEGPQVTALRQEFEQRCREIGLEGDLSIEEGRAARIISDRARWSDLVVVSLAHPPGPKPVDRLGSGFSQLLRRCPRPVLAVPRVASGLSRLLLAYDGSPKSEEALYVAAYLAGRWRAPLVVATVLDATTANETAAGAREYLDKRGIEASFIHPSGVPAPALLAAARENDCDLIVMGGYGFKPLVEIVLGSTVDEVLRSRSRPVLICH